MYLFQLNAIWTPSDFFLIYIPLCIYFNRSKSGNPFSNTHIYIPLCIYFNGTRCLSSIEYPRFTFHYVSISTLCPIIFIFLGVGIYIPLCIYFNRTARATSGLSKHIYIPLCIYFNKKPHYHVIVMFEFTFHYVSISTCLSTSRYKSTTQIYIPLCIYFNHFILQRKIIKICIYIPLCIYFNHLLLLISLMLLLHLHSTMYLFQR